jgi:hypothetical protein
MKIPNLSDIPDLKVVEPGEADLNIKKAKDTESKKTGRTGIMLICEFIEEDAAEALIHTLWLPMKGDDETKANTMLRMLKEFAVGIGLDADDDLETADFEGVDFTALVDIETYEGKDKNVIKRIV